MASTPMRVMPVIGPSMPAWQTYVDEVVDHLYALTTTLPDCLDAVDVEWIWSWLLPDRCYFGVRDRMLFPSHMRESPLKAEFLVREREALQQGKTFLYDDRGIIVLVTPDAEGLAPSQMVAEKVTNIEDWMSRHYTLARFQEPTRRHRILSLLWKIEPPMTALDALKIAQSGESKNFLIDLNQGSVEMLVPPMTRSETLGMLISVLRWLRTEEQKSPTNHSIRMFCEWSKTLIEIDPDGPPQWVTLVRAWRPDLPLKKVPPASH